MAITTRQSSLLVQQDWTKIYQTFKEADFQSYDFETLRKTMIDYLRTYYPEDFNDFIDSSEYVALIDLIAFLGQSLAFRTDLNARENFLDTAERRDSVLKLARMINYVPKRNIPATGYLKFDSVSTTETVYDSTGVNLSNLVITWNDPGNANWLEQFTAILNSSFISNQVVGKPGNSQVIGNIRNDEYSVGIVNGVIPTFSFTSKVEGSTVNFEAVSASSINKTYLYELEPKPTGKFNILYRNDGLGNGSVNTGYFVYFKQGQLQSQDFTLSDSVPNRVVNINFDNINNSDLWLYSLNNKNQSDVSWSAVPSVTGLNVIYNQSSERNLYQVNTRANDQVDLVFGDGAFANIPQGPFRLYYRQSNGLTYKITPDEIRNISIPINYISRTGRVETLTIRASLNYTVANGAARETIEEIKTKAPQQYYVQNRMISAEDYNTLPYTNFSTILKAKAVNRTSSGVSRYLDVIDRSGKYSSTNIFAADGYLYKQEFIDNFQFSYVTNNDIYSVLLNQVKPLLASKEFSHFFYANYERYTIGQAFTEQESLNTNSSVLTLTDGTTTLQVGSGASGNRQYILPGALLKLTAPGGKFFNKHNILKVGIPLANGESVTRYIAVVDVDTELNQIIVNQRIPSGAVVTEVIPVFKNDLPDDFVASMFALIKSYKNFGVRYNVATQEWKIIEGQYLGGDTFSLTNQGSTDSNNLDSSWMIKFEYDGLNYQVYDRGLKYIFESALETKFYYDPDVRVYDSNSGLTLDDQINVLKVNSAPDALASLPEDYTWFIYSNVVEADGYVDSSKVLVTFSDLNTDGIPDNPDIFDSIVAPTVNSNTKFVFFRSVVGYDNFITMVPVPAEDIVTDYQDKESITKDINLYLEGQLFYTYNTDSFYRLTIFNAIRSLTLLTDYTAKVGRDSLYFQYRHNSPNNRRIDPSPNNIMDLYMLTKVYANDYTAWLADYTGVLTEPAAPSSEELKTAYSSLEDYKALSDTIIYNSAKLKPIFGDKADSALQATFKVIKNSNVVISDNDVKSAVIGAINTYFDLNNWDFGETFYFSELSAYLHATLSPNIASIIIVPKDTSKVFGNLYQINAEPNEIIVNAATVDNVEIINSITAAQLNLNLLG